MILERPSVHLLSAVPEGDERAFHRCLQPLERYTSASCACSSFLDRLSKSDQDIEANLSTIFQSVSASKQYWFLRSTCSELRSMLCEWETPMLFLTASCSEYESPEIASYLHKVNNVPQGYPIGKLCCEDPVSVS